MEDQWEELLARRAQIAARLAAAPIAIVEGIVDANGVAAVKIGDEQQWTLQLTLEVWRFVGGSWQDSRLQLRRQVSDDEVERYRQVMRPLGQIRADVRLRVDANPAEPEALLETLPLAIDDPDLAERGRLLQLPVTYEDKLFGTCRFNKRVNWFETNAHWNGTEVLVYLEAATLDTLPSVLKHAHDLWADAVAWGTRVYDRAVADLLELKNATWLDEDEDAVSVDGFKQKLSLQSLRIDEHGAFDFCFADGDLFFGHSIMVEGSLHQGATKAYIAG